MGLTTRLQVQAEWPTLKDLRFFALAEWLTDVAHGVPWGIIG